MTAMWVSGIEPPRSRETSLLGAQTFLRCVGAIARWELLLRLPSLRIFSVTKSPPVTQPPPLADGF